ncbi:MAG: hypothetical protein EU529_02335 [Promethearchaeota archaeon]|nr:MAG: hypothetical protein EU529_02335 [Candidatus Lokiarchaeota archaeon]
MLLGIIIAILYTLGSIVDLWIEAVWGGSGFKMPIISDMTEDLWGFDLFSWRLFVVLPLWLLVVLICIIAIWIGYSMLTTPAPVPLEELEEELAAEEAAEEAAK